MKTSWFQNDEIRALTRVTSWNTGRPNDMSRARRASGRAAVPSLHGIELGQSGCHDDDGLFGATETKGITDHLADHCLSSRTTPRNISVQAPRGDCCSQLEALRAEVSRKAGAFCADPC
jgi:hypothetical protein